MKYLKIVNIFILMFILLLSNNVSTIAAKSKEVKVENINVQEINKNNSLAANIRNNQKQIDAFDKLTNRTLQFDSFIIVNDKNKSKVDMKSFNIINKDYEVLSKKKFNECNDPENIQTNMYTIVNNKNITGTFDTPKYFNIYKKNDEKCELVMQMSNYGVTQATLFNSQLYLELYNTYDKRNRKLYKLEDDTRLVEIANTKNGITSFTKLNEFLLYTYDNNLYVIKNNGEHNLVKNNNSDLIKSATYYNEKLYIIFENKKTKQIYVNKYNANIDKLSKFNNIKQLKMNSTIHLVFESIKDSRDIDFNITSRSSNLIVFSENLVCERDFSSCKYTRISGEGVIGVINNFVVYNSNNIYLSNYDLNTNEALMEYSEIHILENKSKQVQELVVKIFNNKNQYKFIKYDLRKF